MWLVAHSKTGVGRGLEDIHYAKKTLKPYPTSLCPVILPKKFGLWSAVKGLTGGEGKWEGHSVEKSSLSRRLGLEVDGSIVKKEVIC